MEWRKMVPVMGKTVAPSVGERPLVRKKDFPKIPGKIPRVGGLS